MDTSLPSLSACKTPNFVPRFLRAKSSKDKTLLVDRWARPIIDGGGIRKRCFDPGTSELIVLQVLPKRQGSQDYREVKRSIWRKYRYKINKTRFSPSSVLLVARHLRVRVEASPPLGREKQDRQNRAVDQGDDVIALDQVDDGFLLGGGLLAVLAQNDQAMLRRNGYRRRGQKHPLLSTRGEIKRKRASSCLGRVKINVIHFPIPRMEISLGLEISNDVFVYTRRKTSRAREDAASEPPDMYTEVDGKK
ncbi:hypothetical protein EDD85DRAFT_942978 [Armillaria nabsnona]|nr:hypothetical protein EDD85DRAFT_942978 [Armillaria nabsnona]